MTTVDRPGLTQDEILIATKTVVQGLESLRTENNQILGGLQDSLSTITKEEGQHNTVDDKVNIIKRSVDAIELGIGEAQVCIECCLCTYWRCR